MFQVGKKLHLNAAHHRPVAARDAIFRIRFRASIIATPTTHPRPI